MTKEELVEGLVDLLITNFSNKDDVDRLTKEYQKYAIDDRIELVRESRLKAAVKVFIGIKQ